MSRTGVEYGSLGEFLQNSFDAGDLRRFLEGHGFSEVAAFVNWDMSRADIAFRVVELLEMRDRIDARFFDQLERELPAKEAEIERLEALFLEMADRRVAAGSAPVPWDLPTWALVVEDVIA